ncbi:MAG: hypothetical protein V4694_02890 [Pseudomonadota bacterium]
MKKNTLLLVSIFFLFTVSEAKAAQLYTVSATLVSSGQTVNGSFNSAQDAVDYLNGTNLNQAFGSNVDGQAINISVNYRGLPATLAYNSGNTLTLNIDGIVTNKTFTGSSRDAAVDALEDYLKASGGDILNQINKRLAAVSPVDPLAGNPTSLMSQMNDDDFELAFTDSLHDSTEVDKDGKKIGSEMGLGVQYQRYNLAGINSTVYSFSPFSWRKNLGNSETRLLLKIPALRMVTTDNAKTYQASAAVGFYIPLYKTYWAIAPIASIGAVGSEDLAAASAMHGFSLTNKLGFDHNGWGLHLGTLYGIYQTDKLQYNGYVSNPGIKNNILKNSVVVGVPIGIMGFGVDLSATKTQFYGTDLYIENAMDYGVGFVKYSKVDNNKIRFDIKYFTYDAQSVATIGNGTKRITGVSANLKFQY